MFSFQYLEIQIYRKFQAKTGLVLSFFHFVTKTRELSPNWDFLKYLSLEKKLWKFCLNWNFVCHDLNLLGKITFFHKWDNSLNLHPNFRPLLSIKYVAIILKARGMKWRLFYWQSFPKYGCKIQKFEHVQSDLITSIPNLERKTSYSTLCPTSWMIPLSSLGKESTRVRHNALLRWINCAPINAFCRQMDPWWDCSTKTTCSHLLFQFSSSVILILGCWLYSHKESFMTLTQLGLENQHVKVRKIWLCK